MNYSRIAVLAAVMAAATGTGITASMAQTADPLSYPTYPSGGEEMSGSDDQTYTVSTDLCKTLRAQYDMLNQQSIDKAKEISALTAQLTTLAGTITTLQTRIKALEGQTNPTTDSIAEWMRLKAQLEMELQLQSQLQAQRANAQQQLMSILAQRDAVAKQAKAAGCGDFTRLTF